MNGRQLWVRRTSRATMSGTGQILLLAVCSLILGASNVICGDRQSRKTNEQSTLVSYQGNNQLQSQPSRTLTRPNDSQLVQQISAAASNGNHQQLQQPSIYHSIIDNTNSNLQNRGISSAVQASISASGDLNTAAGHHHGHAHGKYYEYRAVPKKKTWKFGYKRGNHKHTISRHEHGKAGKHPHFKTKVKWHDSKSKGKGIHLWDYNHHDKKHYHHG